MLSSKYIMLRKGIEHMEEKTNKVFPDTKGKMLIKGL